ncbi:hypothetical protein G9A89_022894 [Geosiphon pyriformis]|nr:hypothetical protein G9A89_022894 [Geosiphon pyriformis]
MSTVNTPKDTLCNTIAAKEEPNSETTKDLAILKVARQTELITVGGIAVMKKAAKVTGSNNGFKPVLSRKKKRDSVLKDSSGGKIVSPKSDSIDMEKKCLTPTGSKVKTKKALGKPLGKINFLSSNVDNDILLDTPLELLLPLKNLVNVSVCKFFALDIGLDKVVEKSSQEKLQVVRKLFSKINGFGRAFTPSKFAGIIRALFTSKSSLAQTSKKAEKAKILVNTDLKKSSGCSDWAVVVKKISVRTLAEAVCAVLSEFGIIKLIKMQLVGLWQKAISILIGKDAVHVARSNMDKEIWNTRNIYRALLYTLSMETNAHDIWDYVNSVGEKTCAIDHHSVIYAQARCAIVCFESAESLNVVMDTTLVLRGVNLYWFYLGFSKCAKCEKMGYTSLSCSAKIAGGSLFPFLSVHNVLVNPDSFLEMKPTLSVAVDIEKRFAILESSLTSLMEQINELAKKLDSLVLTVSQPSPRCQLPVIPPSQNQVMNKFDGVRIFSSGLDKKFLEAGVAIIMNNFLACHVSKIEKIPGRVILVCLLFKSKISVTVLGLYAGTFSETRFGQALEVNSFIARALNSSTFMVLDGNFNENDSKKSASFRFLVADQIVISVSDYFDTNHKAVMVSVGLGGLLDVHLNELLVAKVVKSLQFGNTSKSSSLLNTWLNANENKALKVQNMLNSSVSSADIFACLFRFRKSYYCSKMHKVKAAKAATIRHAINKRMENFCIDKGSMIRSILDKLFYKMVFDHLVVNSELVLDSSKVKSKVDVIMEEWTRKQSASTLLFILWDH